jgi:hypothetical protein
MKIGAVSGEERRMMERSEELRGDKRQEKYYGMVVV